MKKPIDLITGSSIALAVITVIITIVFFAWWALKEQVVFGSEKFDQAKWREYAANVNHECKRGDMAHDLQSRILVRGVPKPMVMGLLGEPSYDDKNAIEYDLGKCMHVYHVLLIYFDKDGMLLNSRISSH